MKIPLLKELKLRFSTHFNIAIADISPKSNRIFSTEFKTFKQPFYELGFSLSHFLIPFSAEFTWKLNYLGKNNFVFGINTIAL